MKTEKEQALELIERMSDTVPSEAIITELRFRLLVLRRGDEAGLSQHVTSEAEARRRLGKWLNSPGT